MPRYFFDSANGDTDCDCDTEGVELANDDAACAEAIGYLGDLLADRPEVLRTHPLRVSVRSADSDLIAQFEARKVET